MGIMVVVLEMMVEALGIMMVVMLKMTLGMMVVMVRLMVRVLEMMVGDARNDCDAVGDNGGSAGDEGRSVDW